MECGFKHKFKYFVVANSQSKSYMLASYDIMNGGEGCCPMYIYIATTSLCRPVVWINMAEHIRPPSGKRAKRSSLVHKLTAKREPSSSLMVCMRMEECSFVSTETQCRLCVCGYYKRSPQSLRSIALEKRQKLEKLGGLWDAIQLVAAGKSRSLHW